MAEVIQKVQTKESRNRQWLIRWCPALIISFSALAATPWLLGPRCPDHIVIATGHQNGAYYAFAKQYKEILAEQGITLEIRTTAGSVENERLLKSKSESVSLAIIQGGTGNPGAGPLQSLASLYPEPIWVFCRTETPIDQLSQLKGKRIAIGAPDSGTRSIASRLLADNHIGTTDGRTLLFELDAIESSCRLKSGEIDAAFIVMSPESSIVRDLLKTDGIQLLNFRRAAAWQKRYPFLSEAVLPEGLIDFDMDKPDRDIHLLAPTANLVVRDDLHHALIPLILQAVQEVHRSDGLLIQAETFPTTRFADYPVNTDARRYFKSGPSLLYRHLPFGFAAWLDRVKLILLPMLTLLIPLVKAAPPVYRWRIRSKIYRWYRVLHEIDLRLKDADQNLDVAEILGKLRSLEQELLDVSVPLSFMEEFYNLRLHVAFVTNKLSEHDHANEIERRAA